MTWKRRHPIRTTFWPALCALTLAAAGTAGWADVSLPAKLLPLHVAGAQVVNSSNQRVWLRGVNAASLEWSNDGEGHILNTVNTAIRDWHVNLIRLPMAQDRWFGKAPGQTDGGSAYRALVKQIVDTCASHGCYVLLDLHWSDAGRWGRQIGQHDMPDQNSLAFWRSAARAYRNNPAVLFDLYNEPHDVTWAVWRNGGAVTERDRRTGVEQTYQAPGMQMLLDAVRRAGAKNVVVAGGLNWAYDLSGILTNWRLSDTKGHGVIYACHFYPFKGDTVDQWIAKMEAATSKVPVIVSEFGAGASRRSRTPADQWNRQVLQALDDHHWNWTAWDLHPSAGPTLISDWNYTPTPSFGAYVKQALLGTLPPYAPPAPAPAQATPATAPPAGHQG